MNVTQLVTESKTIRNLNTSWIQSAGDDQKPILFFMHGCPDSPLTWKHQMEHFQKQGYPILAPWARGLGESESTHSHERYGLNAIALDHFEILRTLDPTGTRKVIVIGHDIGGIHAWNFARLLEERLLGLIAIDGPELSQMAKRVTKPSQLLKSWYIGFFQLPWIPELMLKFGEKKLLAKTQKSSDSPQTILPFLNQYRQAVRSIPEALKNCPQKISAPVLIIWGNHDPFLLPPTQSEYTSLADNVTIRVLDGGHWIHHQHPGRVNKLIDQFIQKETLP